MVTLESSSIENYELDINPKQSCRLCLINTNLQNIFANTMVDGYIISMPEILRSTIDINTKEDDCMPDKICTECKTKLIEFYTFKKKSKRIEESLRSIFGQKDDKTTCFECTLCSDHPTFISEEELTVHFEIEHTEEYMIDVAGQDEDIEYEEDDSMSNEYNSNESESDQIIHEKEIETKIASRPRGRPRKTAPISNEIEIDETNTSNDEDVTTTTNDLLFDNINVDSYECTVCSIYFSDREQYIEHANTHDFFCEQCLKICTDDYMNHKCEKSNDTDLFCRPCNKRLRSSHQKEQHQKIHESISLLINYIMFYPCHECRLIFIFGNALAVHVEEKHGNDGDEKKPIKLPKASKKIDDTCTDYQFLDDDKDDDEYQNGAYSCGHCNAEYPTSNDTKYHVIIHSKKFPCPMFECGCEYDQLSRLSQHVINKHINTKILQCLHCGLSFPSYDTMQAHIKNDCKEKKFQCPECDKKFFSKKALITHIRTIKVKKFSCEFCEKSFKQHGELVIHLRSHTNERPFKCTICSKAYKTSSMRAAHMDSHITGKTFECTLCDKKLQSRTSYRNHVKRHTEEKKHACDVCGKKFFTKFHKKLHMSKVHK